MFLDVTNSPSERRASGRAILPGTLDFHSGEFRQVEPWRSAPPRSWSKARSASTATCTPASSWFARAAWNRGRRDQPRFRSLLPPHDLHRPRRRTPSESGRHRNRLFRRRGLFLADVLAEQVNLALPMKVICRSDCRGLCPHCGANLNNEECRCEKHGFRSPAGPAGPAEAGLVQKAIKRYTIPFHLGCRR